MDTASLVAAMNDETHMTPLCFYPGVGGRACRLAEPDTLRGDTRVVVHGPMFHEQIISTAVVELLF